MAIYRGVGGVNREITGQYRNVGNVNREIQEQYRNVGNINRLVYQNIKAYTLTNLMIDPDLDNKDYMIFDGFRGDIAVGRYDTGKASPYSDTVFALAVKTTAVKDVWQTAGLRPKAYVDWLINHKFYIAFSCAAQGPTYLTGLWCPTAWANTKSTAPDFALQTIGGYRNWIRCTTIYTSASTITSGLLVGYKSSTAGSTSGESYAYLDGFVIVDLTACFGAGNEPTQAWCDANIPFFEGQTVVYKKPNN